MFVCRKCHKKLNDELRCRNRGLICRSCERSRIYEWRANNKERVRVWTNRSYEKNKTKYRERGRLFERKKRRQVKFVVLAHYSGTDLPQCANPFGLHLPNDPFLVDIRSLSLDHIDNDGAEDRKRRVGNHKGAGSWFYRILIKEGFPSGFQVLCMNCQFVKRNLAEGGRN